MDKQQKEQEYFLARIRSLFDLCQRQGCPKFSDFLTEERTGLGTLFWGGFQGASRVMLGVFPDWMDPDPEEFPIVGCTFRYPAAYALTHRDFLGSLMAQQIRREMVGDIVVQAGETYVFADKRVEKVLLTQIDRIGRVGVQIEKGTPADFQVIQDFREIKGTLASLRLDAAVALCCGVSREKASALISAGMVQKNHCPAENGSIQLADGDVLTVRGKGKFRLETDGVLTRKGRIAVRILQYL